MRIENVMERVEQKSFKPYSKHKMSMKESTRQLQQHYVQKNKELRKAKPQGYDTESKETEQVTNYFTSTGVFS